MPAFPLRLTLLLAACLTLTAPLPRADAETPVPSDSQTSTEPAGAALLVALQTEELFGVMAQEGKAYGTSIEEQMFPGQGKARWATIVEAIYNPQALHQIFAASLTDTLAADPAALAEMQAFFASDLGQRIVVAEIDARRALLDEATEEAAQVNAERLQAERDPKLRQIRDLITSGDLIEQNVAGALSANLAFLQGLDSVAGADTGLDAESMMSEVWSQEADIRAQTELWMLPYMTLAYSDLSQEDMAAYIAFMDTAAGRRLNGALFTAYDQVFRKVSYDLGRAAALLMQGNDI